MPYCCVVNRKDALKGHCDCAAFEFDDLPLAYLAALPEFNVTVDFDAAFCYHRLCHAAALTKTSDFQQVIQLDKFMTV